MDKTSCTTRTTEPVGVPRRGCGCCEDSVAGGLAVTGSFRHGDVPSGNLLHSYGKSPSLRGKSTTSSTRTRRGGSCLRALGIYCRTLFSSTERACAVHQPGPFVRALCDTDALLPKVVLDTLHFKLQCSHFTLRAYTSHSTLHTSCHLISSQLLSSHFISSLLIYVI